MIGYATATTVECAASTDSVAKAARASLVSIRLNVGVLGHLFPDAELNAHERSQLLRRAGKPLEADVIEPRLNLSAVDDLAQRGVEFVDNRRRCAGRRDQTSPSIE